MRVGTICYTTRQGIGWLPKRFYDAGVITDVMTFRHGSRPSYLKEWYPEGTVELVGRPFTGPVVEAFIKSVDVMMFFETPFDWNVIDLCRRLGTKTVIVPMYEWVPVRRPFEPDKWICPSLLDQRYFPDSLFLEIPVELGTWRQRTKATKFLHGAGNLGFRGHKGTREILLALPMCETPIDFTIRAQDVDGFNKLMNSLAMQWLTSSEHLYLPGGGTLTIQRGEGDHGSLYAEHDVFVMAEKYNGLSLPLREARAAGMLVVTSNRYPMNQWLPEEPLIPVHSYSKQRVSGAYLEYDEAEVRPEDIAAKLDELNGQDIKCYSAQGAIWAAEHSWGRLKQAWLEELAR